MKIDAPLSFAPIFRSYLWGGANLRSRLNKSVPDDGVWAESWELVDHGVDQSLVQAGPFQGWSLRKLIETFPQEILGCNTSKKHATFPLLLKYLDCNNVLSVQVHPDDRYAMRMNPPDLGKTEAWYIVDAKPGAVLYAGLNREVDKEQLIEAIRDGRTEDCLHKIYPTAGDCVFIPAGTVHALGSGLIVAEIQQASDTTFRLFDWNRVDASGKSRPLHIEQALEVIDFESGPISMTQTSAADGLRNTNLVSCDKFLLDKVCQDTTLNFNDSFAIVTVPHGSASIRYAGGRMELALGESILIPAAMGDIELEVADSSVALVARLPS